MTQGPFSFCLSPTTCQVSWVWDAIAASDRGLHKLSNLLLLPSSFGQIESIICRKTLKKFCFCFLGLGPSVARSVLGVWNIKLTSSPRSFRCLAPRCYVILKPMSQAFDEVPGSVCAVHGCHDKSEANFPAEVDFAVLSRAITEEPIRLTRFSKRISWCKRSCKLYASCANPPA